jgi:hypothetical protein
MVSTANAAYVISVVDAGTGLSVGTANPGDTLHLALQMTGTDPVDSFGVGVQATPGVLHYPDVYTLAPNNPGLFVTGGANDFSVPPYFSALTEVANTFWNGTGRFIAFDVMVDPNAPTNSTADVVPVVDFFNAGFDNVDVTAGTPFVLTIVPEPATLALLGIGGLLAVRRRFVA